jgi:hypothetical protein
MSGHAEKTRAEQFVTQGRHQFLRRENGGAQIAAMAVPCQSGSTRRLNLILVGTGLANIRSQLGLLAKVVVTLGIVLMIAGVAWRGVSIENIERIWNSLLARPSGPMAFRFILQPLMAAIVAIRDGLYDVRGNRSPFLWTILSNPKERVGRLHEGLNATARIILLGLTMDTVYQAMVFKAFYPYEALIIVLLLAFIPYLLIRGVTSRISRWYRIHAQNFANTAGK